MIVADGRVNYRYATPECRLRREHASPSWRNRGPAQDQRYFRHIVRTHGWTETTGDIVIIPEALCRANADPEGDLRSGYYKLSNTSANRVSTLHSIFPITGGTLAH
jgi:hypothetical protein